MVDVLRVRRGWLLGVMAGQSLLSSIITLGALRNFGLCNSGSSLARHTKVTSTVPPRKCVNGLEDIFETKISLPTLKQCWLASVSADFLAPDSPPLTGAAYAGIGTGWNAVRRLYG